MLTMTLFRTRNKLLVIVIIVIAVATTIAYRGYCTYRYNQSIDWVVNCGGSITPDKRGDVDPWIIDISNTNTDDSDVYNLEGLKFSQNRFVLNISNNRHLTSACLKQLKQLPINKIIAKNTTFSQHQLQQLGLHVSIEN